MLLIPVIAVLTLMTVVLASGCITHNPTAPQYRCSYMPPVYIPEISFPIYHAPVSHISTIPASENLASITNTEFNGVALSTGTTMAGSVGDVVPVRVIFNALENVSDVRVKVYMDGYRDDVSASTSRFDIESGNTYTKLLSLKLPSDSKDLSEKYTLYVEVSSKDNKDSVEYTISMQRKSYTFEILSADYSTKVSTDDVVPVAIVVKNTGYDRMDDTYVVASIPALGVSSQGYVGDLIPAESYVGYDNEEDSMSKTVYLKIPADAKSGVYELDIKAYNSDAETTIKKLISVSNIASTLVLTTAKNQDLSAGETITYNLIIVNSANDVKAFNIRTTSGDSLNVSAPSVITVGPDASKTISITAHAVEDATVGTHTFSVSVDGKQTVFGANVVRSSTSDSVVAITIILAIIFVALLAILVVLLTRKEKPAEEVETSYY